jgi:hypothetical protein
LALLGRGSAGSGPSKALACHFPLSGQSRDGDLQILATQVAPDKIGRP